LRKLDYSLPANRKDKDRASHADRDQQFRYLNETAKRFLAQGDPVISVDTKKKERVGNFKNNVRKWHKKGPAPKVNIHDFPSLGEGTAIPSGAYDVYRNEGMVNVGMTHDTAEFRGGEHPALVAAIRRTALCASAAALHLRRQRWKQPKSEPRVEVLPAAVQRRGGVGNRGGALPTWNEQMEQIEHRLVSFETVVNMISATKTSQGLRVKAVLDKRRYQTGVKISDEQMKELNLQPHQQNPEWNYSILPRNARPKHSRW